MKKKFWTILLTLLLSLTSILPISLSAQTSQEGYESLDLYSEYVIVKNVTLGRTYYESGVDTQMYPASMTKIMTALVALELIEDLDAKVTITSEMLEGLYALGASVAGYSVGDSATYEDLLYGLLLPSGADCANALAISLAGSEDAFVSLMNDKAEELGMDDTHFTNTTGLHDDDHYSTVYDISLLLETAIQNETLERILSSDYYVTSDEEYVFYSTIYSYELNYGYDADIIKGGKTGYTEEAGQCLASYAEIGDDTIIVVTAKTQSDTDDAYHLTDALSIYSFVYYNYGTNLIIKKGVTIDTINVKYAKEEDIVFNAYESIEAWTYEGNNDYEIILTLDDDIEAPLYAGESIGTITIVQDGIVIYEGDAILTEDIERDWIEYIVDHIVQLLYQLRYVFLGIVLLILLLVLIRRINIYRKRHRRRYEKKSRKRRRGRR